MNDAAPQMEMPRYKSKKLVWALEVKSIDGNTVTPADKGYAPIEMKPEVFARYTPVKGDFLVQYGDGYWSVSPRKPFIEGYDRV